MFPLFEEQSASKETGSAPDPKSPLLRPPGYEVGLNVNSTILTHWSLFPLSVNFERGMVARPMNSSAPTWSLSHMSRSSVWSIASSTTADQSSFHTGWRLLFTTWRMIHEGAFNVRGLIFSSIFYRALPMLTTHGEITEGVRVSNEVHLHQIPGHQSPYWLSCRYTYIHYNAEKLNLLSSSFVYAHFLAYLASTRVILKTPFNWGHLKT